MALLVEAKNGHDISPFDAFPTPDKTDDLTEKVRMISLANPMPKSH